MCRETGYEYRCWVWLLEFGMGTSHDTGKGVGYGYRCEVRIKGLGMYTGVLYG